MNPINTADPFNLIGRARPTPAPADEPAPPVEASEAPAPKVKRPYTRRVQAAPAPAPASMSDQPAATPQQEEKLIAGVFTTGELYINVGGNSLQLTPQQRAELEAFILMRKADAQLDVGPAARQRRVCEKCRSRKGYTAFPSGGAVCFSCTRNAQP